MKRSQQVRIFSRPGTKDTLLLENHVYDVHLSTYDNTPYSHLNPIFHYLYFKNLLKETKYLILNILIWFNPFQYHL